MDSPAIAGRITFGIPGKEISLFLPVKPTRTDPTNLRWPEEPRKWIIPRPLKPLSHKRAVQVFYRRHWKVIKLLLRTPIGEPTRKGKRFVHYVCIKVLPKLIPLLRYFSGKRRVLLSQVIAKFQWVDASYRYCLTTRPTLLS